MNQNTSLVRHWSSYCLGEECNETVECQRTVTVRLTPSSCHGRADDIVRGTWLDKIQITRLRGNTSTCLRREEQWICSASKHLDSHWHIVHRVDRTQSSVVELNCSHSPWARDFARYNLLSPLVVWKETKEHRSIIRLLMNRSTLRHRCTDIDFATECIRCQVRCQDSDWSTVEQDRRSVLQVERQRRCAQDRCYSVQQCHWEH